MIQEETRNNKKTIIAILGILLLLGLVVGITYAAFSLTELGGNNQVKTGKISMSYTEPNNAMEISNAYPMTDAEGKASSNYFEFTVTSHATTNAGSNVEVVIPYEINISSKAVEGDKTQLPENKIKIYLVKMNGVEEEVVMPTLLSNLSASTLQAGNTKVYDTSDMYKNAGSQTTTVYRLRAWIDSSFDISGNGTYQYKFTVNINSQDAFVQQAGGTTPVATDEACFTYTTDATSATITGYNCDEWNEEGLPTITDVVIPKKLGGKDVVIIGVGAFQYKGLTSVVMPDSVTSIGNYAFGWGVLTSAKLSSNLTSIGESAFCVNKLTSVIIPSSVTRIGNNAFLSNLLTGTITIPNSVTFIGVYAFSENKLTNVVLPEGVVRISAESFSKNQLTSVIIPSNVTAIDTSAFANNNLTSVIIPSGVTTMGSNAFLKNATSNPGLTTIINKTIYNWNWGNIVNGTPGFNFITGTVVNAYGNVVISAS